MNNLLVVFNFLCIFRSVNFFFFFLVKKISYLKNKNCIYEPKIGGKNSYLQYGFIVIIKNAIKIAHDEIFYEQTKNIEIDCHFIHHYTFHGLLFLDSISSIDQFIGILTKSLSPYHLCTCWDLLLKSFVRVINLALKKESIFQPKYIVINLITLK